MKSTGQLAASTVQGAEQAQRPQDQLDRMSMSLFEAFLDSPSRAILNSTISSCKSIEELAEENDIPISTAYRRVHRLVDSGLLMTERIVITEGGKKFALFRSTLQGVRIEVHQTGIQVSCTPNQRVPDIAFRIWRFKNRDLGP